MGKKSPEAWANQPKIKSVLLAFTIPKTPGQIEKELNIKKLKIDPFLKKGLLESLNPHARKGRFYLTTLKARKLLQLSETRKGISKNWQLIGKIMASPKQKLAVLLTIDSQERTSEEIRLRAAKMNPCLSRISTKAVLRELIAEKLIDTELIERRRFYWITEQGEKIRNELPLAQTSPLSSSA